MLFYYLLVLGGVLSHPHIFSFSLFFFALEIPSTPVYDWINPNSEKLKNLLLIIQLRSRVKIEPRFTDCLLLPSPCAIEQRILRYFIYWKTGKIDRWPLTCCWWCTEWRKGGSWKGLWQVQQEHEAISRILEEAAWITFGVLAVSQNRGDWGWLKRGNTVRVMPFFIVKNEPR